MSTPLPSVIQRCPVCEEHTVEVSPFNRLRKESPTETLSQLNARARRFYEDKVVEALVPHMRAEHQHVVDPDWFIRQANGWDH